MIRVVRGDGPLRPAKARDIGYEGNQSPLYRLFQAFRRASPQGKNGLWSRVLVVRDNNRAQEMADLFAKGEPDYLTDERWWEMVEEQDREILGDPADPSNPPNIPGGFEDGPAPGPGGEDPSEPEPPAPEPPPRRPLHGLTRKYEHPTFRVDFETQAFAVQPGDPELDGGVPWVFRLEDSATRAYVFLVDPLHPIFRSTTMTPLDALLTELTHRTVDYTSAQGASVAGVLAEFREEYCVDSRLDPAEIIISAGTVLDEIARAVPEIFRADQNLDLHAELTDAEKAAVARRMANRNVANPVEAIADGSFWSYAERSSLRGLFARHPEFFLDGNYWEDPYATLNYGDHQVTEDAKANVLSRYGAYLDDAVWLANQNPSDLEDAGRDTLVRAACSLRLLRPDVAG